MAETFIRKEAVVMKAVGHVLSLCPGLTVWRQNTGGVPIQGATGRRFVRMGFPGIPDWIGFVNASGPAKLCGRFVGIEVKRPGGKLRSEQEDFARGLLMAGALWAKVTSVDELSAALKEWGVMK